MSLMCHALSLGLCQHVLHLVQWSPELLMSLTLSGTPWLPVLLRLAKLPYFVATWNHDFQHVIEGI